MSKVVVVVDDSQTVHITLDMALEDLINNKVIKKVSYLNPLDFLDDVENGMDFDLLITDINMPQMNGLDMVVELKKNDNIKIKPMLALTTESSAEMKKKGKQIGLTGWITKPFTNDKVIMAVKRVLRIR